MLCDILIVIIDLWLDFTGKHAKMSVQLVKVVTWKRKLSYQKKVSFKLLFEQFQIYIPFQVLESTRGYIHKIIWHLNQFF